MDGATFKKYVEHYGEENIIGIGFDNSAGVTFGKGEFTLEQIYVDALEAIQYVSFDSRGNPFHVIKHVENIQSIIVRDSSINTKSYDRISIRG